MCILMPMQKAQLSALNAALFPALTRETMELVRGFIESDKLHPTRETLDLILESRGHKTILPSSFTIEPNYDSLA